MNSTERAFSERIRALIGENPHVLVAFSGGCDSLALLALCSAVLEKGCVKAVYVNHRLRDAAELEKEISLNKSNCLKLGVQLVVRELDEGEVSSLAARRGGGTEEAARILRYRILEEERQRTGSSWILTAHHKQDQVETILMRLSNGSPSTTLSGIREKDERRHLARPILGFSRSELEEYNRGRNLGWSTDSTNSDACFSRNAVRNDVIPAIRDIWPGFENAMLRLGEEARACNQGYEGNQAYERNQGYDGNKSNQSNQGNQLQSVSLPYNLSSFAGKNAAQKMAVLYDLWDIVFGERELPMTLVARVLDAIADYENEGADATVGANGGIFTLYHGKLYLTDPEEDETYKVFSAEISALQPQTISLPGNLTFRSGKGAEEYLQVNSLNDNMKLRMNPDNFNGNTIIRFAAEGDRIRLKGGWKNVGRLLQDMGIPKVLRGRVPVLEDRDGICAVFGTAQGGRDRICVKFRTSLAPNGFPLYIVSKG